MTSFFLIFKKTPLIHEKKVFCQERKSNTTTFPFSFYGAVSNKLIEAKINSQTADIAFILNAIKVIVSKKIIFFLYFLYT
ncbi:hypothetical protein C9J19_20265 [Photobacterium phosphoreum]|nr:hypothetical protein C9J19_20265 [Photobacterium phosphoreum]